MNRRRRWLLVAAILVVATGPTGRAEDLTGAWSIALRVNGRLLGQQDDARAAALTVEANRAARLPSIKNQTFNALVAPAPGFSVPGQGTSGSTSNSNGNGSSAATAGLALLGRGQNDIPISNTAVVFPIYSGGRLKHNVEAASAQLGATRRGIPHGTRLEADRRGGVRGRSPRKKICL